MELIIRFETQYDGGIYQDHDTGWAVDYDARHHPLPGQDSGLRDWYRGNNIEARYRYHFGFNSLTQARAWFYNYKWLEKLDILKAKLVIYAVRKQHTVGGFAQAVFLKHEAERIAEFPCVALHEPEFDGTLERLLGAVQGSRGVRGTSPKVHSVGELEKSQFAEFVKYCLTDLD